MSAPGPASGHYQDTGLLAPYNPDQQYESIDVVRQRITKSLNDQYFEATTLIVDSGELTRHFSQTTCPMFRHIPQEDRDTPTGWVSGHNAVRSYFDLLGMYWTRFARLQPNSVVVDPVNKTSQFVLDIDWKWCKSGLPGWLETVECNQTYDWEYKVVKAEYITLSGRETCWSVRSKSITAKDVAKLTEPEEYSSLDAFFFPGR